MASKFQVVFDCASPNKMAEFWSEALGYELQPPPPNFESWEAFADANNIPEDQRDGIAALIDPDGGPRLLFLRVPESKTAKNRVHLDVNLSGDGDQSEQRKMRVSAEVERLEALGATRIDDFEELGSYWMMMKDPEGNEFCVH